MIYLALFFRWTRCLAALLAFFSVGGLLAGILAAAVIFILWNILYAISLTLSALFNTHG